MDARFRTVLLLVVFFIAAFTIRLATLQLGSSEWVNKAENLTSDRYTIPPSRGQIFDRNGTLMVGSEATHDLMVTPKSLPDKPGWQSDAARWAGMSEEDLKKALQKAKRYSSYKASPVRKGLSIEAHALMAAEIHRFPGFQFRTRPVRNHINKSAGHLLGEYAETSPEDLKADRFYSMGDRIGRSGLEQVYELELRGVKGRESVMVDVRNRVRDVGTTQEGDRPAEAGQDLHLTLDLPLQQLAERLMKGKKGSVVAIEPATGEVLVLVSAPDFDPSRLVGPERGTYYRQLLDDPDKPLFNRAIKATYRPGSIWKMVQGLIALEEGRIRPWTRFDCDRELIGCHGPHTRDDLGNAVVHSCNPYFYRVMQRVVNSGKGKGRFERAANGLDSWRDRALAFGFGTDLGARLPGTSRGNVPGSADYDRIYGARRWDFGTIYSISIGEGELLTTPLQMANLAATLANRGWYRLPHFVRSLGTDGKPEGLGSRQETGIAPQHFSPIVRAMNQVIEEQTGTGLRAKIDGLKVCGKTGTVQDGPRKDHSVFMAFAPMDTPKIALSVYVENSGFGGEWAAPISAILMEQYLLGEVRDSTRLQRILAADLSDPFPEPEPTSPAIDSATIAPINAVR
ncbi:MAG: peptidoglycan glycosyltransferase [Flavobacteriales bacterium]|nr:peptidoglycan glycosyltransferase [Flavobacteriales bacterium]